MKSVEAAEKSPDDAVAAMLKINPKAGNPKTLRISLDATTPLYHTKENPSGTTVPGAADRMSRRPWT
jgi:hypothetical protein